MNVLSKSQRSFHYCCYTLNGDNWSNWSYGSFSKASVPEKLSYPKGPQPPRSTDIAGSTEFSQDDPLWKRVNLQNIIQSIRVLSEFVSKNRLDKMMTILDNRTDNVRFVFENPSNPNNVWAILRTLDSFGIQFADIVSNSSSNSNSIRLREMKTALGSQKWMTVHQFVNISDCIQRLKGEGYIILATDLHEKSISIRDFDFAINSMNLSVSGDEAGSVKREKYAIIMGNEKDGISKESRSQADYLIHIPMNGFAESFNLSVASAIICAVISSKGLTRPNLTDEIKMRILFVWISRTVRESLAILRSKGLPFGGQRV